METLIRKGITLLTAGLLIAGTAEARDRELPQRLFIPRPATIQDNAHAQQVQAAYFHATATGNTSQLTHLIDTYHIPINLRNESGLTALHIAARRANAETINLLLGAGADPTLTAQVTINGGSPIQVTPLRWALETGNAKTFIALLLRTEQLPENFPVNRRLRNAEAGLTPLHIAARSGNANTINLLLDAGADPTLTAQVIIDSDTTIHVTPLRWALDAGNAGTFIALLQRTEQLPENFPVNRRLRNAEAGLTPLHIAARSGNANTINLLLDAGADPTLTAEVTIDNDAPIRVTPLRWALETGNNETFATLIQRSNLSAQAVLELLLDAIEIGDVDALKVLLGLPSAGSLTNAPFGDEGSTLLHEAAQRGNAAMVNLLLNRGADPWARAYFNLEGENGETVEAELSPLGLALEAGNTETFVTILRRIAIDAVIDGHTPLQHAAREGLLELVREFLDADPAAINTIPESFQENAPLHIAAAMGNMEMLNLLLEEGRNANIDLQNGCYLYRRTALQEALLHGRFGAFLRLLRAGANPNIADLNGITALHMAVERFHENEDQPDNRFLVQLLRLGNLHFDARDYEGYTALHIAAQNGNTEAVRLLLQQEDVNVNVQTRSEERGDEIIPGITPLHLAAENGHRATVIELIQAGADPSIRNHYDHTPADAARWQADYARDNEHEDLANDLDRLANEIELGLHTYLDIDPDYQTQIDLGAMAQIIRNPVQQTTLMGLMALLLAQIETIQHGAQAR